ncbi:T9SS type A sorting domain-containing protein [Pontibacter sp. SGAir0037]|uniref:DUF7619 domain-containing protein n=1 Tax=Pontibacter sp. SGAir0037 TaxID=2571030 RepID=UPI0010CD19C3|nr:T9SS type A sorting domain-containing protein [Pontibacter sp. SGAir0037]QCR23154.1 hypothetical protein C1N53_12910 [Pontibacter sp. SGAir0037]
MKSFFALVVALFILCSCSFAQKAVLLKRFMAIDSLSDYQFAADNVFVPRQSYFEGYQISTGKAFATDNTAVVYRMQRFGSAGSAILYNSTRQDGFGHLTASDHATTRKLLDKVVGVNFVNGSKFTFVVNASTDGPSGLYATDGTVAGTKALMQYDYVSPYDVKAIYAAAEDKVYFALYRDTVADIYQTDGTAAGTRLIGRVENEATSSNLSSYDQSFFLKDGEHVYYVVSKYIAGEAYTTAASCYLVASGGIQHTGTYQNISTYEEGWQIKDGAAYSFDGVAGYFTKAEGGKSVSFLKANYGLFVGEFQDKVLLLANQSNKVGYDLYETDGTEAGTKLIQTQVVRSKVIEFDGKLYFWATTSRYGTELWQYDGRSAALVEDIKAGEAGFLSFPDPQFQIVDNTLYFAAAVADVQNSHAINLELYKLSGNAGSIYLSTFADYNRNGQQEASEPFLPYQHFELGEDGRQIYTSHNLTKLNLDNGSYTLSLKPQQGWKMATGQETVELVLPLHENQTFTFGLVPEQEITAVEAKLVSLAPPRCGFLTTYELSYLNKGTRQASGKIQLVPEKQFSLISANPAPDVVSGDTLQWNLSGLELQQHGLIQLHFRMPTFESMGDTLTSVVLTKFQSAGSTTVAADTSMLQQILLCSYDPNDIQVNPVGVTEKHLTKKDQPLEYLIRFQNTGNAEAINIMVANSIEENLDLRSLRILGSSHPMYTSVRNNTLHFYFDNILLPDSTSNEPGSHGYVLYAIKPKAGLPDSTRIENTADIYFDYNPPIHTNTVFSTLVTELPAVKTDGPLAAGKNTEKADLTVFPNPASNTLALEWQGSMQGRSSYYIVNSLGQEVLRGEFTGRATSSIPVTHLGRGFYFVRVINNGKTACKRLVLQ